jgi:predicted secreted protein
MTAAKTGWGGQFWLDSAGDVLTELVEVVSFTLPNSQAETVEATHLKSPNRRREYIAGMIEDGELELVVNYVPGSATDILLCAALADGVTRDYKAVVPRATANWEITGDCIVTGYDRGSVIADGKMEGTVTLRLTGDATEAAAA